MTKHYRITTLWEITTEVEAENEEEALDKSHDLVIETLVAARLPIDACLDEYYTPDVEEFTPWRLKKSLEVLTGKN